jgi:hypothetical protein
MGSRMTDHKKKVKGKHTFSQSPAWNTGPAKKDFVTKVVGLESQTCDFENAKYTAMYQKTVDATANHIQKDYKGGQEIVNAIRELSLPKLQSPSIQRQAPLEQSTQGRYSCGNRTCKRQRKELHCLPRTRSMHTLLSLGSVHLNLTARSRVWTGMSKPAAIRTWFSCCWSSKATASGFTTTNRASIHSRMQALSIDILLRLWCYHHGVRGTLQGTGGRSWDVWGRIRKQAGADQSPDQPRSAGNVDNPDADKVKKRLGLCCESYLSCMILKGTDNIRFSQLKTDLANNMTKGQYNFPKTILESKLLLNDYKVPLRQQSAKDLGSNG